MHRYDGQRKHIIHSLSTLLYQLHILSFLLSPAIWVLLARILSNFHLSAPRDLDSTRTLRFWFILIIIFNWGALWNHAKEGAAQGRSVVLDFVGLSYEPSKAHLLALDFFIIFLSMVLTTIAYETSYAADMPPDTVDSLLPPPTTSTSLPLDSHEQVKTAYVIDLRLSTIVERLRHPPPPPPPRNVSRDDLLPMPNITSLRLPTGLQMLLRARQQQRRRAMGTAAARRTGGDDGGRGDGDTDDEDDDERQDVPGGLHADRT